MRHENLLTREDGTQIRLVAIYCPNPIGTSSIDCFALVKTPQAADWSCVTYGPTGDKSLGGLSVDEYIKFGRKGLLSIVRPNEIFKVSQELQRKLEFPSGCEVTLQ